MSTVLSTNVVDEAVIAAKDACIDLAEIGKAAGVPIKLQPKVTRLIRAIAALERAAKAGAR